MTQKLVVRSLAQSYQIIKEMNHYQEWDGRFLSDRRNGSFSRHLLTEKETGSPFASCLNTRNGLYVY